MTTGPVRDGILRVLRESELPLTQRQIMDALLDDGTLQYAAQPASTIRHHVINAFHDGDIVTVPDTKPTEFRLKEED